ncbi:MAG TPA: hypothetical protein VJB87_02515 [Candidatus Nanoarchaeia archaeon]|nr:hypothetical protein [Candidatus Nanoarchaeia archaeon]
MTLDKIPQHDLEKFVTGKYYDSMMEPMDMDLMRRLATCQAFPFIFMQFYVDKIPFLRTNDLRDILPTQVTRRFVLECSDYGEPITSTRKEEQLRGLPEWNESLGKVGKRFIYAGQGRLVVVPEKRKVRFRFHDTEDHRLDRTHYEQMQLVLEDWCKTKTYGHVALETVRGKKT